MLPWWSSSAFTDFLLFVSFVHTQRKKREAVTDGDDEDVCVPPCHGQARLGGCLAGRQDEKSLHRSRTRNVFERFRMRKKEAIAMRCRKTGKPCCH